MVENRQTIARTAINHGREEPVVYVTEDRRIAEELATEFGYGVVVQKNSTNRKGQGDQPMNLWLCRMQSQRETAASANTTATRLEYGLSLDVSQCHKHFTKNAFGRLEPHRNYKHFQDFHVVLLSSIRIITETFSGFVSKKKS